VSKVIKRIADIEGETFTGPGLGEYDTSTPAGLAGNDAMVTSMRHAAGLE
jgi:hypothetical protein